MNIFRPERVDKSPFGFDKDSQPRTTRPDGRTPRGKRQFKFYHGIQYEKHVAELLAREYGEDRVIHGQWFSYCKYEKSAKASYCQTDIIVLPETGRKNIIVVECKTTLDYKAFGKLRDLYIPVVKGAKCWKSKSVVGVQICKHLKRIYDYEILESLDPLFDLPAAQCHKDFLYPIRKFPFK